MERRRMAGEFRLPGSTYQGIASIIIAYGAREEAGPADVRKLDSAHPASASRNNAFLASVGILEGEKERTITPQGRELALALAHRDREGIRRNWRRVVSGSEFLQNIVSAVTIRQGMSRPDLRAYIAQAAKQPRNKPVMTGADAVIDILRAAGLLREEDGRVVASYGGEEEPEVRELEAAEVSLAAPAPAGISIHLHIRCEADELEDLAPRLRRLLRELSGLDRGS